MATVNPSNHSGKSMKPSLPWGHKILREKAIELYKDGSVAPSAVLANLLIASASEYLDADLLCGLPRQMSPDVNKIIADALQKARMPNSDLVKIFDGVIALSWVNKKSQPSLAPASQSKPPFKNMPGSKAAKPNSSGVRNKPVPAKAPIIVRAGSKLSGTK